MQCSACASLDAKKKIYDHHLVNVINDTEAQGYIDQNVPEHYLFKGLVRICESCGYGELETQLDEEKIASYYDMAFWGKNNLTQRVQDAIAGDFSSTHLARARRQQEFISSYRTIDTFNKVLEIGAGDALLSRELQKYSLTDAKFDVCEPGEHWLPYYEKYNINKVADFFPFKANKTYDIIVTSHWLEHIQHVENTLVGLGNMLEQEGLLMIEVPNTAHAYWDLPVKDTPHIHFFTERSLSKFAAKAGFEVVDSGEFGILFEEHKAGKRPNYEDLGRNSKGYSLLILLRKH